MNGSEIGTCDAIDPLHPLQHLLPTPVPITQNMPCNVVIHDYPSKLHRTRLPCQFTPMYASFVDLQNNERLGEKSNHCISTEGSDFAKTVFQQQIIVCHSTHK
jgi:hypothetical protein